MCFGSENLLEPFTVLSKDTVAIHIVLLQLHPESPQDSQSL